MKKDNNNAMAVAYNTGNGYSITLMNEEGVTSPINIFSDWAEMIKYLLDKGFNTEDIIDFNRDVPSSNQLAIVFFKTPKSFYVGPYMIPIKRGN